MFLLDGKESTTDFSEEDEDRLDFIVNILEKWGLVKSVVDVDRFAQSNVVIISHKDKHKYSLKAKYTLGSKDEYFHGRKSKEKEE
jgi:hypothetical protein